MPKLELSPRYTEKEWEVLRAMVKKRYPKKTFREDQSGISLMLTDEIRKKYSGGNGSDFKCEETAEQSNKKQKHFDLWLPEDVVKIIQCKAKKLNIRPATLILRTIINPLLVAEDSNSI